MKSFFLLLEMVSYLFAFFLFIKKKELAIIYLPVLFFARAIIDPVISASVYYLTISLLVLMLVAKNASYYQRNIFAFLLFIYFILLLPSSSDLVLIRPFVFGVLWLFTLIPLISAIYRKYSKELIFKELSCSAMMVLGLFIANVGISTLKGFSPNAMYGITSGILYGNIFGAGFNVLAACIFVVSLRFIEQRRLIHFLVLVISVTLILLSLRRSVMVLSLLGVAVAYLSMLSFKRARMFIVVGGLTMMIGYLIFATTNFADLFQERYELRKLDERELREEKRFIEYELIYKDMFVYNEYSPLTGYEPFNSWGNYGRGILGDRSLHGDLTSIAHSSGLIGLVLYLLMMMTAFLQSWRAVENKTDKLIVFFSLLAFGVFTITGRYTDIGATTMLYLVLMLPLAKAETYEDIPFLDESDSLPASEHTDPVIEVY